ncbi:PQQ-binding-like beta-propeller repeat protein [Granulicella mallensis]|uniref:Pyrrolo-quinoline quinone repeat-containing protein n=1 Tax=Granulicella mallensis (strain ATCC BAA-1857 / DSM 23137 / MP5ACTX8) TaxID=682795 RepID=G8NTP9_GRAMM|nr:pyrrolo-quinoline quinone repeat-containing protein [Granulicella mallensis]AEU36373.1 Pyrrolo-quinoline quinone repeat-containing protein [Granulicella mallensis MP5ACTX8]
MGPVSKVMRGCLARWFRTGFSAGLGLIVLCAALTSCGGKKAAADFSLSSTPVAITLVPGATGQQVSVTATAANGFSGMVAVAITGLPSGVTAQPATLTLTPGMAQSVIITAAASAMAGNATLTLTGSSGALTHTSTVMATISAPPPDFTLTLAPASLTVVGGATGVPVSVTASAVNGFSSTVAVALKGLPAGVTANPATLSLVPGTAQSTVLTAALSVMPSTATVTFTGTSGSIVHTASLALTVQGVALTNAPDVTTFHYDLARDGLNAQETILTQGNVNSTQFGKIGFDTVDGKVDAQPLYLANVSIRGQLHNVLYVATEHDSVYAFDADTGTQLWMTSILGSGETTSDDHGCSQITPEIGITSTPVIDRKQGSNGTLFTIGMTKDAGGGYHHRLHALDLTTGADLSTPTEIAASYPGTGDNSQNGNVVFDPSQYAERAALLLVNGTIYTGWTSHCDVGLYTGWVMGYSESTLLQTQLLNLVPNGHEGSIWMSGNGMAADSSGFIYLLDANGTFDTTLTSTGFPTQGDYGNAMVKLSTASGKLAVVDYFETYNGSAESSEDLDLGSGGEMLLPDQMDARGGVHHLIVGAGKDKNIYLADRDNMGKFNQASAPMDSNIYQEIPGAMAGLVYSTPAYFNGVVYYAADGDVLKAFPLTNADMATSPSSKTSVIFQHPGPTPTISANGTQNGIVWALESGLTMPGVLHAYDPANLAHELYNSGQAANGRDSFGNGNKFIAPVIVNGKVYVGTQNGVAVFGLLPTQ